MSDFVLIDNDEVVFDSMFGVASVTVQPGKMEGTGKTSLNSKAVCVEGDETKVEVPGCSYMAPPHTIQGAGTLTIAALGEDQKGQKTSAGGKAVLLRGGKFKAEFTVQKPALQPGTPTVPDQVGKKYTGTGEFKTSNNKYKAT